MRIELTIPGHPVVLKNSKQLIIVHGRRIIKSNPRVEAYQHKAIASLCEQWGNRSPITGPVNAAIRSCGAWKRAALNLPDASNLYQVVEDILESAGVLEDDRQIESHDGSARVCLCDTCENRPLFKAGRKRGRPKDDCGAVKRCPHEHVEVVIETLDEGETPAQREREETGASYG
jgi:Holliday junction resolvase RusA-like endonuclease